jgi:uncharacterized RDD family membrane protein YckC
VELSFEIQTAQNVPLAIEPASAGQRIGATIVDGALGLAWMIAAFQVLDAANAASEFTWIVGVLVPPFLYHLVMEVLFEGRTLGKMAFKTRVARLDGAQPTLGQYGLRWLLRIVDVSISTGIVALISVVLTRRSQRLGDIAAGTTVVRQRRRLELTNVLYPLVQPGYEPVFPEAERLTDSEIRTVRSVIARLHISGRDARSNRLAQRAKRSIERRLGLEEARMKPEVFLRTIVRDHVAQLDRFGTPA